MRKRKDETGTQKEEVTLEESGKTTVRTEENKKKLTNRLARIEGQIKGMRRMLDNDAYCIDILVQSSAVKAALSSFEKELLSEHLKGCVTKDILDGKEESVDELVTMIHRMVR